jgi:hypothetical protein
MSRWVERAVEFTRSLTRFGADSVRSAEARDPFTPRQLQELQSTLTSTIPESLIEFLCTESASCNCEYYLTFKRAPTESAVALLGAEAAALFAETHVYGGASLCQSEFFAEWNSESVLGVFDDLDRECAELWRHAFIFKAIHNADFLGLYTGGGFVDPPVVYLNHEAEVHRPLAPSLAHFLGEWEKLHYIGPEIWELAPFINAETGYLDANAGNLDVLSARFRPPDF